MRQIFNRKKQFLAVLENLYEMLNFIGKQVQRADLEKSSRLKIELAAEEAIVNIMIHGYESESGPGLVTIHCFSTKEHAFKVVITDSGRPFNPLEVMERLKELSSDEMILEIGGYGIYFIVNMMDEVDYQRYNDMNVLTLIIYHP